jgi:hypothetical protein
MMPPSPAPRRPALDELRKQWRVVAALGVLALALAAWMLYLAREGGRPRAPALRDDSVYQNTREGFRFLVPEDWHQHARSEVPTGKTEKERLLVGYKRLSADKPALLEVSLVDLPAATDLEAYLAEPSYGVTRWQAAARPEPLHIQGAEAQRFVFTARVDADNMTREVVAFRRGERLYLFTGVFRTADTTARAQFRQAVESTLWKN